MYVFFWVRDMLKYDKTADKSLSVICYGTWAGRLNRRQALHVCVGWESKTQDVRSRPRTTAPRTREYLAVDVPETDGHPSITSTYVRNTAIETFLQFIYLLTKRFLTYS